MLKHLLLASAFAISALFCPQPASAGEKLVLGFIVKQPEENWFQSEWVGADRIAAKYNFEVMKIGGADGEKTLNAIDTVAARGGKGFVICTPDVKLGPAIMARANSHGMKVITVDDRLVDASGKPLAEVPYVGLSAYKIGNLVGQAIYDESRRRGWKADESGVCVVTFDELETARERTSGAVDRLLELGWPKDKIFYAPQRTTDIPGAFDAASVLMTQHPEIKNWGACGLNDNAALGAVRAMEGRGLKAENIIGVGLGGAECKVELEKTQPTGFYGSIFISAITHGTLPTEMLYDWVVNGKEPPLDTRTAGTLITRDNFREVYKDAGMD